MYVTLKNTTFKENTPFIHIVTKNLKNLTFFFIYAYFETIIYVYKIKHDNVRKFLKNISI